jgi:lipopolysaccharide export LptBFGC system permease protein LptF
MTRPRGSLIRAIAARLLDAQAIERVIDPALADFQLESDAAAATGRPWRRRWLWVTTSIALGQGAGALVTSLVATVAALVLFALPPLARFALVDWRLVALVVPSAVPVALPVGLTFGLFVGRGAPVCARFTRRFVAIAIAASTASFILLSWIVPDANQLFRERAFSHLVSRHVEDTAPRRPLARGTNELTIAMLTQRMRADSRQPVSPIVAFTYHQHWALAAANVVLVTFALVAIGRWRPRPIAGAAIALGTCIAYWLLMECGKQYALGGAWPTAAAAWLPNVVFAGTAILIAAATPRDLPTGSRSG